MFGIERIPKKPRLLIGKILLVFMIPIFIILVVGGNIWETVKFFFSNLCHDVKHEYDYFVDYLSQKA